MKIAFFLFVTTIGQCCAQTPLISYKSHSGNSESYFIDPNSNFGEIEDFQANYQMYEYEYINDSVVYRITSNGYQIIARDTVEKPVEQSMLLFQYTDESKQNRIRDSLLYIQDSLLREEYKKANKPDENGALPIAENPGNGNPPSFLLVLFAVSGLLLVKLLMRDRNPSTTA